MLGTIDRPLRVGEVLAQTFRIYGSRPLAFAAIGVLESAARALGLTDINFFAWAVVVALAFVVCFSLTVLVASGSGLASAVATLRRQALPLALCVPVVGLPIALGAYDLLFVVLAIIWLAVISCAVPEIVTDDPASPQPAFTRFRQALRASATLAQAGFSHALLVVLVLVLIGFLFSPLIAGALSAYGDQTQIAAALIANAVLRPVLFLGLAVLWAEQTVRAQEVLGARSRRR